jgi:hypothetical protein
VSFEERAGPSSAEQCYPKQRIWRVSVRRQGGSWLSLRGADSPRKPGALELRAAGKKHSGYGQGYGEGPSMLGWADNGKRCTYGGLGCTRKEGVLRHGGAFTRVVPSCCITSRCARGLNSQHSGDTCAWQPKTCKVAGKGGPYVTLPQNAMGTPVRPPSVARRVIAGGGQVGRGPRYKVQVPP